MNETVEIWRIQAVAVAVSLAAMIFIFELIRRKKLREKYSLIWFLAGTVMIILSVWREGLDRLAHALGVGYAPALLFLVALFFGMILLIHFSVVISDLSEKNKTLAQEVALLKAELKNLQKN
ncbi:MAG: DUF2304 domain-containing protein [Bacteroidetes bacterium]|nr:DUF2304 domain-containing protein [Bacteroidota bacterium]